MKNDVSRREDEERSISPYTGRVLAVKAPRYAVHHPRAEIRRSSSARRDTPKRARTFSFLCTNHLKPQGRFIGVGTWSQW